MSEQWGLSQCVDYTLSHLGKEDIRYLRTIDPQDGVLHHTMGRWIRNNCKLWEHGTDRVADDIVREYNAGNIDSKHLRDNDFIHPELEFDILNAKAIPPMKGITIKDGEQVQTDTYPDRTLQHPDNCSAVIIEIVVKRIQDEHAR